MPLLWLSAKEIRATKCKNSEFKTPKGFRGYKMYKVIKIFFLAFFLLIAAFFANYFGLVSIPWLKINAIPTYGDEIHQTDDAAKKAFAE
jgi:hypothetical protein